MQSFGQSKEEKKFLSAKKALEFVKNGSVIGLGTGTTADIFISLLGKKVQQEGLKIKCVATSSRTKNNAANYNLEIVSLDDVKKIDVAIDGADQVDKQKNLIKGYGGALLREKIVAYNSSKFIVIVDDSKLSNKLNKAVPVEFLPFAKRVVFEGLRKIGAKEIKQRMEGSQNFISDNHNYIADVYFGEIKNPAQLEDKINQISGIVDNGIFSKKKPLVISNGQIIK
jgi:ribose 5-phosphate isomerase A